MKFALTLLAIAASSANASVLSLTPDNYDSLTAGKTVFIKFYAPWCGHCKKMAPDWEALAKEWEGNDIGLVAEVDCTTEGKPLCDANGVRGFPTIKWGDPSDLQDYKGGRDFDALKKFADGNLKPVCSPANLDLCDAEKKAEIEKMMEMSEEDLDTKIAELTKKSLEAETTFKTEVEKLQKTYQQLQADKEATEKEINESGLGLMKSVRAQLKKAAADKEEL
jgi:protein disulfide-isomerase-like protein